MKVALLISTYNWPEALKIVLKSLALQSVLPDEVLIADDGSDYSTKEVIDDYSKEVKFPVVHVWQEDEGFRKSVILNKAVAHTNCDYIVQVDGDCILHRDFFKDHLARIEKNTFLFGSRVNIKADAVENVLEMKDPNFSLFSPSIKNKTRNLRIPALQKLYRSKPEFSQKTRGCNLSYWKEDFLKINGYDETMEGWGREDSEMVLRLLNTGVKGKRLRYGGIVYHIYHAEKSKEFLLRNSEIQRRTIQEKRVWCEEGVQKYLKDQNE